MACRVLIMLFLSVTLGMADIMIHSYYPPIPFFWVSGWNVVLIVISFDIKEDYFRSLYCIIVNVLACLKYNTFLLSNPQNKEMIISLMLCFRLTPGLYFPSDHSLHSILLAKASCDVSKLIYPFLSEFPTECPPMVHGLPHPYHLSTKNGTEAGHDTVQSSLSRVVYQLLDMFSTSSSQHTKVWQLAIILVMKPAITEILWSLIWMSMWDFI